MPQLPRLSTPRRCTALVLPLVLIGASARAQPPPREPPLRLTWETDDPSCDGKDVAARALRLVTAGVEPRPLSARIEVQRDGEQWLVRLQTQSGEQSGRRILRAESCDELERAIALLLAMSMESRGDVLPPEVPLPAPLEPPPPAVLPAPAPPAPSVPSPAPLEPSNEKPRATPRPGPAARDRAPATEPMARAGIDLGLFARMDGKAAWGLKPGLGLGAGAVVGVSIGDFDIGVGGSIWPETRARVLDRPGRLSVSRQNVSLRACWNAWRPTAWVVAPCLAPELTFFEYVSERVEAPENGRVGPLPSVSAALDVRYALFDGLSVVLSPGVTWEQPQPFRITLGGSPAAPGTPSSPVIEEVYKTTGLGPRCEIGVDARF